MSEKEAKARIKINKLLEESGWRFFDDENGIANIELEQNVKITENHINEFGENFEKIENGFAVSAGEIDQNIDKVVEYVESEIMDKPNEFFTLDKLRKSGNIDWRISLKQLLSSIFNKETIPTKKELLDDEFQKFVSDKKPDYANIAEMKYFFNAYATDKNLQGIIDSQTYTDLNVNPSFNLNDFKAVPKEWRNVIPEYIKDYVSLNQFV